MLLSRCVLVMCVIQPWFVTFTPQVMLLNGVKRPKLLDPSRSPMHHRDTSTGQVCPLGTPMYRLQHWAARKNPLHLRTNETTLKALDGRVLVMLNLCLHGGSILFASVRALSGVLCTHRSLSGAVIAIFEVYGAISARFPTFTPT